MNLSIKIYDSISIEKLKYEASLSDLKRSRILLHDSTQDQIQQMLIVIHRDSRIEMHRHPKHKSESYHMIEGVMRVSYWDIESEKFSVIDYDASNNENNPIFGRHGNGIWHMPQSLTEWSVYLETYDGPFVKEEDVEFLTND